MPEAGHMTTLTNSFLAVNPSSCESSVTRLARVSYAFVPMPQNIGEVLTPSEERLYGVLIALAQRGIVEPCIRVLASIIKRSERTVQRLQRSMALKGVLEIIERRISACRNAPNIYKLLGLVFHRGVGDKNVTEKNGKLLKTTTPAPGRGARGKPDQSHEALRYEIRRLQDKLDSERMQRAYVDRGKLHTEGKEWRLSKALERTRIAAAACIGRYMGPETPIDWAAVEAAQQRERERVATLKAEAERVRLERDRMNREAIEARERAAIEAWPETLKTVEKLERMLAGKR